MVIVASNDPLSPTRSTSSAKRTPDPQQTGPLASLTGTEEMPENKEEDSNNSEQQMKELSKRNVKPKYWNSNKTLPTRTQVSIATI
jgi:hypothetical protein